MSSVVIVGTQWGDEGKGKIVDILTGSADIVVRFQGGPNAGHTVVVGDKQTILHQIPSGILHKGKKCIVGNGVVIDAEKLINEIDEVKAQGYFIDDSALLISDKSHLIMPYHKHIDIAREKKKGKNKIGTTGRGIGPAYEDKVARHGIRLIDIFNDDLFKKKLETNLEEKNFYLQNYFGEEPLSVESVFNNYTQYRSALEKHLGNTALFLQNAVSDGKAILFEGAQGTMLDIDHGTYPFVTSSNTVSAEAALGSGVGPKCLDTIAGISKAYTTRVGAGPFPTEQNDETGDYLRDKGAEYGATTGRPRRCGWFDAMTVRHAIQLNSITHLILTKLDVLSGLETIKVCTGYMFNGSMIPAFPADFETLEQCVPVYEEVPGWKEDLSAVEDFNDLPLQAREYIGYIEKVTGVTVAMVSVGTRRNQIITLKELFAA